MPMRRDESFRQCAKAVKAGKSGNALTVNFLRAFLLKRTTKKKKEYAVNFCSLP